MAVFPIDIFPGESETDVTHFLTEECVEYHFYSDKDIRSLIRPRNPAGHKGTFGHALMIAGSEGKAGAAILSCMAALRSGCGLVTGWVPASALQALLVRLPEAMTVIRQDNKAVPALTRFNAIGYGPGAGLDTDDILYVLLTAGLPLVIDADGLTVLSTHKDWYELLSPKIVLTPHPIEFDRLTHSHASVFERCRTQLAFSKRYNVIVLLKGRYTSVTTPGGEIYFNTTGNAGMATGGSGDVLTGIITSLLAQGYETGTAAVLGAFLHGYAGDRAAEKISKTALIASDMVDRIGDFFLSFEK